MKIIPAIIPDSYKSIEINVAKVKEVARTIQLDFVDGTVAQKRTWIFNNKEQERLSAILREEEGLPFWQDVNYELDLMVSDVLKHIETFIALGPSKIIFHVEYIDEKSMISFFESLPEVIRSTISFGMAIELETDAKILAPYMPYIQTIQCMGIAHIGSQGTPFDERVYMQIEHVRALYPDKTISVDGGVTEEHAATLVSRGVRELIVGSAVFQSIDPHGTIRRLRDICKQTISQQENSM